MESNFTDKQDKKSTIKILWRLTRPHTLTATFVPVVAGTVYSMFFVKVDIWLFIAMLFACLGLQIAANLFNEYYDFKRGLDTKESVGIGGAIVRDGMQPKLVLKLALSSYFVAALLGIYICINSSWWLAVIGAVGMAVGYLYTGGPLPIAYTPFGELFAGIFIGTAFVLISFFIQTGLVSTQSILLSVPIAILVAAINLSNNIRDIEEDKLGGRRTLAILIGRKNAVNILAAAFIISYIWIIGLITIGSMTYWLLLVFLSIPKATQAVARFKEGTPDKMALAMKATAQTNTIFGLLMSIALVISYFWNK